MGRGEANAININQEHCHSTAHERAPHAQLDEGEKDTEKRPNAISARSIFKN